MSELSESDKQRIKNISAAVIANATVHADGLPNAEQRAALFEDITAGMIKELKPSMYGQNIKNVDGEGYLVNKYGRTAAGATAIITMTDPDTNEKYLLLGRKYLDAKNPEAGLGQLICPGGYMNPQSPAGDKPTGAYDASLTDTILREVKEETSISFPEGYKPKSVGTNSDVTGNAGVHTINEFFHFDLVGKPSEQTFKASDDLATLEWVNIRALQKDNSLAPQPDGSGLSRYNAVTANGVVSIRDLHGDYIEQTLGIMQQKDLTSITTVSNDNDTKWRDLVQQSSAAKEVGLVR
jgi:ADP-ribose pyrophosphatase YjhB (NUDIX family)